MKAYFCIVFICFSGLIFSQTPDYKACKSMTDSSCNEAAHAGFKRELIGSLYSSTGYYFNDSIYFSFEINEEGQIHVLEDFFLNSPKARDLLRQQLENSAHKFTELSRGKSFSIALVMDIPSRFQSFTEVDSVENPVAIKYCRSFNEKGKKGCTRYLASVIESKLTGETKASGKLSARLYLEKGNLKAIKYTNFPLTKSYSDLIFDAYNQHSRSFIDWKDSVNWDKQWIQLEISSFKDSTERHKHALNHLDYLASLNKDSLFLEELLVVSSNYYQGGQRSDFMVSQLGKIGYDKREYFKVGGRKYEVDSIRNYRAGPTGTDPLLRFESVPVYAGCDPDDDNEELKRCFQMGILRFVSRNFNFPEEARHAGISGRVLVDFVIDESGAIYHIKITDSVHPLLDFEVIRVASLIPDMEKPAMLKGKPVKMSFTLPINARLN